jgi:hypothetical protein
MLAAGAVSVLIDAASAFLYRDVLALPVPSDAELIPAPPHRHTAAMGLSTVAASRNAATRAVSFAWDILGRARAWMTSAPPSHPPSCDSSSDDRITTLASDLESDMPPAEASHRWRWISVVWQVWRELWDVAGLSHLESEALQAEFVAVTDGVVARKKEQNC